ncbi:MAG: SDR family oxidoreductase [Bacteroidota bacterium]
MPTVVITGASQGIGRAIALSFSDLPDSRLALLSRNEDRLEEVAALCADHGADAVIMPCDVTDEEAVASVARAILKEWGAPNVLVNNAGLFRPGMLADTSPAVFREQVEANLTSAFLVTQSFLPAMIERRNGHIFFMASVASIRAYAGGVAYCAAKHGLLGLSRVVREETKNSGIRVTAVMPGATFTPSWEGTELPEERFISPDDVADTVMSAYQLSDRAVVEEVLVRPQLGDI